MKLTRMPTIGRMPTLRMIASLCTLLLASCAQRPAGLLKWYPRLDTAELAQSPHVHFISNLKGYQQTMDYTCGPASLMAIAAFYGVPDMALNRETEERIAREAGARDPKKLGPGEAPGLPPEAAVAWLRKQGLKAELSFDEAGDYSGLTRLRDNIHKGVPSLVLWVGYGEHWVIAVGYDDRGTPETADDVILFADSADVCDDYQDGYTFANADKFYWCWFDVWYYGKLKWRPMITVLGRE
jgi:hypothetical protein